MDDRPSNARPLNELLRAPSLTDRDERSMDCTWIDPSFRALTDRDVPPLMDDDDWLVEALRDDAPSLLFDERPLWLERSLRSSWSRRSACAVLPVSTTIVRPIATTRLKTISQRMGSAFLKGRPIQSPISSGFVEDAAENGRSRFDRCMVVHRPGRSARCLEAVPRIRHASVLATSNPTGIHGICSHAGGTRSEKSVVILRTRCRSQDLRLECPV